MGRCPKTNSHQNTASRSSQKNLELTEAAYGVGKSPQLDLLDANLSLRNAKLDYMSAVVDWNTAYNALLKATGEY
jgi:OMF family outer membrane factor